VVPVAPPRLTVVAEGYLPTLPKAAADMSAAARPDLVGKDPAVLHFGVADLAKVARSVTWATGPNLEIMQLERAPDKYSWVTLSSDSKVLDAEIRRRTGAYADVGTDQDVHVGGQRAVLRTIPTNDGVSYLMRWEPVSGVVAHVHVRAGLQHEVWELADRIRLNEATRCLVPFGLRHLPMNIRLLGCRVSLRGYEDTTGTSVKWLRLVDAELSVGTAFDRARIGLYADPKRLMVTEPHASTTGGDEAPPIPGETFALSGNSSMPMQLYIDGGYKELVGKLGPDALVMGDDLNNPETWPEPVR
jgi:hypothetical protein